MPITFYHNPACGTSRNALAIVRASGDAAHGVTVVEYLRDPPPRERLAALLRAAGLTPREGLRVKGNEGLLADLDLTEADPDPARDAERLLDAMVAHPVLINRPLVEAPLGTVLARPSERVAEVLREPPDHYTKEDGETVRLGSER